MLAANLSWDRQVACRLNQSMNHMPNLPLTLKEGLSLPFPIPSLLRSLDYQSGHCYHLVLSVALILPCLSFCTAENDKFCPFSKLKCGGESSMLICIDFFKASISTFLHNESIKIWSLGSFLVVHWLGLHAFTAEVMGLIPVQGTKIP